MGKVSEVDIKGHKYRYEYVDGETLYKGPVGDSPALSEAEFMKQASLENFEEPRWDVDMDDIKGTKLKKMLGAKMAKFQWHNKNKSGGNFGYFIRYGDDYNSETDADLTGAYDTEKNLLHLFWGPSSEAGTRIYHRGHPDSPCKNMDEVREVLVKNRFQIRQRNRRKRVIGPDGEEIPGPGGL